VLARSFLSDIDAGKPLHVFVVNVDNVVAPFPVPFVGNDVTIWRWHPDNRVTSWPRK
jgi:hypothetical protein